MGSEIFYSEVKIILSYWVMFETERQFYMLVCYFFFLYFRSGVLAMTTQIQAVLGEWIWMEHCLFSLHTTD